MRSLHHHHPPLIVWLGSTFGDAITRECKAISPAANLWQRRMIRALEDHGAHVNLIGHIPEPVWPRGELFVGSRAESMEHGSGTIVPYLNLPLVRAHSLGAAYARQARMHLKSTPPACALITYNVSYQAWRVGRLARSLRVPWIALVADVPHTVVRRQCHDLMTSAASGRVCLSWYEYQRTSGPKLYLEGGILPRSFVQLPFRGRQPAILYSGTLTKYGGVDLLLRSFTFVKNRDIELWICGKGAADEVISYSNRDPRIKFMGYLPDDQLEKLCERCWAFINPRPTSLPENQSNFPSKVLFYLTYAKPVISTWTEGLNPTYRRVLTVVDDNDPERLAAMIEQVISLDERGRDRTARTIEQFIQEGHSWNAQAARLLSWIVDEI